MLPMKRETPPAAKSAFSRALQRFAARQEERRRETRIGFIIDATGSRDATWEQAQTIQATMFRSIAKLSALSLRLAHFGGHRSRRSRLDDVIRAPWRRRWRASDA